MPQFNEGQEVEIRLEIYPMVGIAVYDWIKAKVIHKYTLKPGDPEDWYAVELPDGRTADLSATRIRETTQ